MTLTNSELESVRTKVDQKVSFILSSPVYNNLSEEELENKRIQLTEKYLEAEFDKCADRPIPKPPKPDAVATAIMD